MIYELRIQTADGKTAVRTWEGRDGLNACQRYADGHRNEVVLAWRDVPHGLFIGGDPRQVIG